MTTLTCIRCQKKRYLSKHNEEKLTKREGDLSAYEYVCRKCKTEIKSNQ